MSRGLLFAMLAVAALPAIATERLVTIDAPASVAAGVQIKVSIRAHTDAGEGEQIGFFHAEYSIDDGKTWTGIVYEDHIGTEATRLGTFTAGPEGSKAMVRVRIAFRGGPAGDVDFNGAAIKWKNSWEDWEQPPAKYATITVKSP